MAEQTKAQDKKEHKDAKKAGAAAESADTRSKFQGFSAGGPAGPEKAPERKDFPPGSFGDGPYESAMAKWKAKHQSDAIKGR